MERDEFERKQREREERERLREERARQRDEEQRERDERQRLRDEQTRQQAGAFIREVRDDIRALQRELTEHKEETIKAINEVRQDLNAQFNKLDKEMLVVTTERGYERRTLAVVGSICLAGGAALGPLVLWLFKKIAGVA